MADRFAEFIRILRKIIQFPQMTLSEVEAEIINEVLRQLLDNNPNYGPQTKQVFKAMLEGTKKYMDLASEVESYIETHDVTQ